MKKLYIFLAACPMVVMAVYFAFAIRCEREHNGGLGIKARAYPIDTIEIHSKRFLVVEVHDYVKGDTYNDTIAMPSRVPSTLEDYDVKRRKYRFRK